MISDTKEKFCDEVTKTASDAGPDFRRTVEIRPLEITYVGNFLSRHGLNPTYSELLVPQLQTLGYCVRPVSSFSTRIFRLLDVIRGIIQARKARGIVIIDLYSGRMAFPAARLATRICSSLRKPYLLVLHGGQLPNRLERSRKTLAAMLSGAAHVISPSAYLAENLAGICPITVIPNAINVADYPYRCRGPVRPKCFYLRALHRNYGALVAIEALGLVAKRFDDVTLRMAGPEMDDCRPDCERLITQQGLNGRVTLLGRISKEQIRQEGDAADLFLNPTFVDNTPVSVVEAMAMGLCIISTTAGGLPRLLKDGSSALLVPPRDPKALAEAICRVVENPGLARQLSRNARVAAESMDWGCALPLWKKVIETSCQT